jgi:hypothetical protein
MMQEGGLDCVTGLGKYKGRLIILLDVNRVLTAKDHGPEAGLEKLAQPGNAQGTTKPGSTEGAVLGTAAGLVKKGVSAGK